jgi:hypothetical protein
MCAVGNTALPSKAVAAASSTRSRSGPQLNAVNVFQNLEHCLDVLHVEIVSVGLLVRAFVQKRPD